MDWSVDWSVDWAQVRWEGRVMFWLQLGLGLIILVGVIYSLPRLAKGWRQLAVFLGWLCVGFTAFSSVYYSFGEAFACDDGLKTGAACEYDFLALYLGFFTLCGVLIWGVIRLFVRRR